MMKRWAVAFTLGLYLAGCARVAAPPALQASAETPAPVLRLANAPNFRDVGGYRTTDGHHVRLGIAYRSDQMNLLGDADLAVLGALHPSAVVDLRTLTERQREPDRVPQGIDHVILDVAADSTQSLGGDMRLAMAQIAQGQGEALLVEANREFVTLPSARQSYASLIRLMLSSKGPVVFHCTAGKDRTGWASAIVLTLLGVPRETVMQDYLLSNERLAAKNAAILSALAASRSTIPAAYLEPVLTVKPAYIEAAFAEVERSYGSFENYARSGLGLSVDEIWRLRERFLTR
jgi:protein-tyrosine phosphatase